MMERPVCAICHSPLTDWYNVCPKNSTCQRKWEAREYFRKLDNSEDYLYGVTYKMEEEE